MKRFCLIATLLCLLLSGCGQYINEPVTFYYIRSEYHEDMNGILASEKREASGHRDDLAYLLALYMMGPADDELISPIPRGISIYNLESDENSVEIILSESGRVMSDSQYTLACACLSMTCMELTGAKTVTISSGERSITMDDTNLVLHDFSTAAPLEETK